jgi:hypothetical protein
LYGGFDDSHGDEFLDTTVTFLIKLCRKDSTVLWPSIKSKKHKGLKSLGHSIGQLEIPNDVDIIKGNISITIRETTVLEKSFVVEMVLKFISKENVG